MYAVQSQQFAQYLVRILTQPDHQPAYRWRLPEWIHHPSIVAALLPMQSVLTYQIYHDCGKPFCLQIDEQGRRHFPDHAHLSADLWESLFGPSDISWLMRHDMDIHLAKAVDVPGIAQTPYWATQLMTGLAELHANGVMFGGIESTSFKIKYKALDKTGRRVLALHSGG